MRLVGNRRLDVHMCEPGTKAGMRLAGDEASWE